ncbi:MAG TPA: hypothetical protein VMV10_26690 [Pirellulales bacterium]|nr:hypothetical protein [Pirellulales bacterium]
MSRSSCGFLGVLLTATAFTAAGYADPPLQLAPQKGVLLLRSGQVLAGTIAPAGDHYLVSLEHGEIRVQSGKVDKLCKNLREAYEHKRTRVELGKAAEHVALADWCLQNGLFELADRELSYALAADVNYPRIRLVERRLQMARRGAEPAAPHARPVEKGPTNEELDRMVRGMSGAAVEQFTSTIQPLLVNTCTTAGCHLPHSDTKLQLLRIPPNSPPSRRTTQRNLFSVWRQIDSGNPTASPLLTVPLQQHGNAKAAMFSDHEAEQYRLLAAWVGELARAPKPTQPASVDKPASTLLQTMPPPGTGRTLEPGAAAARDEGSQSVKPQQPSSEIDLVSFDKTPETNAQTPGGQPASPTKPKKTGEIKPFEPDYVPVDPFDPEIFNRRYHPRGGE